MRRRRRRRNAGAGGVLHADNPLIQRADELQTASVSSSQSDVVIFSARDEHELLSEDDRILRTACAQGITGAEGGVNERVDELTVVMHDLGPSDSAIMSANPDIRNRRCQSAPPSRPQGRLWDERFKAVYHRKRPTSADSSKKK